VQDKDLFVVFGIFPGKHEQVAVRVVEPQFSALVFAVLQVVQGVKLLAANHVVDPVEIGNCEFNVDTDAFCQAVEMLEQRWMGCLHGRALAQQQGGSFTLSDQQKIGKAPAGIDSFHREAERVAIELFTAVEIFHRQGYGQAQDITYIYWPFNGVRIEACPAFGLGTT